MNANNPPGTAPEGDRAPNATVPLNAPCPGSASARPDRPKPDGWGKTWQITPTSREAALWRYCCAKAGEKLIPFILRAIHERCRQVVAERVARGKSVEQWVVEQLQDTTPGGTLIQPQMSTDEHKAET